MNKILIATALVLATASGAFAEDSSSSFPQNIYGPAAVQQKVLEGRNVALTGQQNVIVRSQDGFDRASNPYAGGGF